MGCVGGRRIEVRKMTVKKQLHQFLIGIVVVLQLTGCSTVQVQSDYDPKADFTSLKTFAWLPEPPQKTGDPRIDDNSLLATRIRAAVETELATKGFQQTGLDQADFALGYHVILNKETNVQVVDRYYNYGPGWGGRYGNRYPDYYRYDRPQAYVFEFDLGTLIVDVVKPAKRELIWRGTVTDEVNFSASREAKDEKIRNAVHEMFAGFPPK
jgi:hypothetical protein